MKKTIILFCLLMPILLVSRVIRVPFQYHTIQLGINAASNGDTVLVANGVYRGSGNTNLVFYGKSIHLKSAHGYEHTYIDGENTSRCVNFIYGETNNTIIEGFTIENGYDADYAGGIYCDNSSPTIIGNFIYNCIGGNVGGGITLSNSQAGLYGNIIASNQAPEESEKDLGYGGGLAIINGSNVTFSYNLVINNYADLGGAIFIDNQSTINIFNATIYNNKSIISSGGIVAKAHSQLNMNTSILGSNEGNITDQIALLTGSSATVVYSDVENGYSGIGNINQDPEFVSPSAGPGPSYNIFGTDWHLQASSPCIDQGDPSLSYDDDNTIRDMGLLYYPHIADFSSDSPYGYAPHTVTFSNESTGEASNFYWDFDSDGIWDSFEENPSYTYSSSGVYTVTMKITNTAWENTKIKENIIVIQDNQLDKPENVSINISSDRVHLTWDSVLNASYYLIYACNNPFGEYVYVDTTSANTYITDDISEYDKLFFKIIGFDGTTEELSKFIEKNKILQIKPK